MGMLRATLVGLLIYLAVLAAVFAACTRRPGTPRPAPRSAPVRLLAGVSTLVVFSTATAVLGSPTTAALLRSSRLDKVSDSQDAQDRLWSELTPHWQPSAPYSWVSHRGFLSSSRAMFDVWSWFHAWAGIWIGALMSPLLHPELGWCQAYSLNVACHVVFEVVENTPITRWVWRELLGSEALGDYHGDSGLNSLGDLTAYSVGFGLLWAIYKLRLEKMISEPAGDEAVESIELTELHDLHDHDQLQELDPATDETDR